MKKEILIKTEKSYLIKMSFEKYEDLLEDCIDEIKDLLEVKPVIVIRGRKCNQKRDVGFFSDKSEGYKYSGRIAKAQPLTKNLKKLMKKVNKYCKGKCNGILINKYNDGTENIGDHSDDERHLKEGCDIVTISFGQTRKFRVKGKESDYKKDFSLRHLDYVIMGGDFQKEFTHGIPQEKKIRNARYSFTFRHHTS